MGPTGPWRPASSWPRSITANSGTLAVEEIPRFSATIDEVQEEKALANEYFGKLLEEVRRRGQEAGIEVKTGIRVGHPAKTIVEVAIEGKFDLILVGHSGLSEVWARFLGTTAEKVSRHAPCSVLIVR